MFFLKAAFCRIYQAVFRIALPILPYREPKIVVSCTKLSEILEQEKVTSVLIVTDKWIAANGLTAPVTEALKTQKQSMRIR